MSGEFTPDEVKGVLKAAATELGEGNYAVLKYLKPEAFCKVQIYPDGDQWCALLGENIQEGICGFGKTPYGAALSILRGPDG